MRLLERGPGGEFVLTKPFLNRDIPEYAILSHTWGPDSEEVSFHDLTNGTGQAKTGYEKIRFCANQADRDDLRYFWIDTCCIDKTNSTELGEAINSMFRWYQNAARCYVFLSDVSLPDVQGSQAPPFQLCESAFRASRWFTRGWTLQELLAPRSVEFFASDGTRLGDKTTLQRQIHEVTGISISALCGESIEGFNIEERFKWAESRQTTKDEDWAYSLLGIFGVFIPLIYGEGRESAVRRLRKEIRGKGNEADPDDGNPKAASAVCLVPYTSNPDFIGRSDILGKLTDALGFGPTRTNPTAQPRLALFGLGGVGYVPSFDFCRPFANSSLARHKLRYHSCTNFDRHNPRSPSSGSTPAPWSDSARRIRTSRRNAQFQAKMTPMPTSCRWGMSGASRQDG